jgi:hypothetical protein
LPLKFLYFAFCYENFGGYPPTASTFFFSTFFYFLK